MQESVRDSGHANLGFSAIVNAAETLSVLHRHPGVRAVLSGHLHRAFDNTRDGIRFLGAPSVPVGAFPQRERLATVPDSVITNLSPAVG